MMITGQELYKAMLQVLDENEKIPYTQDGLDFLLTETEKLLPKGGFKISVESIEDITAEQKAQRYLPKITIEYDK